MMPTPKYCHGYSLINDELSIEQNLIINQNMQLGEDNEDSPIAKQQETTDNLETENVSLEQKKNNESRPKRQKRAVSKLSYDYFEVFNYSTNTGMKIFCEALDKKHKEINKY
ncbi:hypothetical protein TKK_0000172 [Trichogramma kaykai]